MMLAICPQTPSWPRVGNAKVFVAGKPLEMLGFSRTLPVVCAGIDGHSLWFANVGKTQSKTERQMARG